MADDKNKANIVPFSVYMSDAAWQKQRRLVQKCEAEIAWFGLCTIPEERNFCLVNEIIVPTQEVTATEVDYSEAYLHDVMDQLLEEDREDDIKRIRYFGHSHYKAGVHLSPTDMNEFIDPMMEIGMDYFICHVQNQKGEMLTRLDVRTPMKVCMEVDLIHALPTDIEEWAEKEIEEKVTIKKNEIAKTSQPAVAGGSSRGQSGYSGYGGNTTKKGRGYRSYDTKIHGVTIPNWTEDEILMAPLTVCEDRDQACFFPRAVVHNEKTNSRVYFENGAWVGTTDLPKELIESDWAQHDAGKNLRAAMMKSQGFIIKEEEEGAAPKQDAKAKTKGSAEGKAKAPQGGAKSQGKQPQTQTATKAKSGGQGQQPKRKPKPLKRKLLLEEMEDRKLPDPLVGEDMPVDEEDDYSLALQMGGWIDPDSFDTFESMSQIDTNDKDALDSLSESDMAEMANLAVLSGLSERELREWGFRRDPETGGLMIADL